MEKAKNKLVLTEDNEHFITRDFDGRESVKLAILGLSDSGAGKELIVSEVWSPEDEDYVRRDSGSASLRSESVYRIYEKAIRSGRRAVGAMHCHPHKAYISEKDRKDVEKHLSVLADLKINRYVQVITGTDGIQAFTYHLGNGGWVRENVDYIKVYRRNGIGILQPTNSEFHLDFSIDEELHNRTLQIGGGIGHALEMARFLQWLIIGQGGIGNTLAHLLKHLGVEKLGLVDPDVLDRTNANRFLGFRPGDEGKPKIEVARRELLAFNPRMHISTYQERFPSENTKRAFKESDVVIIAPDDHRARIQGAILSNLYCKPLFAGGAAIYVDDQASPYCMVCSTQFQQAPPMGPCLKCLGIREEHPRHVRELLIQARRSYVKGYRNPLPTPASVISLHSACAYLLLRNVLYYLSDIRDARVPHHVIYDEISMTIQDVSSLFQQRQDCPICGSQGYQCYGDYTPTIPSKEELEAQLEAEPFELEGEVTDAQQR